MEKNKLINELESCHYHTVIGYFNGLYLPVKAVYESDGKVIIEFKDITKIKGE